MCSMCWVETYDNNYKDYLRMAHVVCQNVLENWQHVKNTFSTYEIGSTNCHMVYGWIEINFQVHGSMHQVWQQWIKNQPDAQ
jgi:hypothetical protein